MQHVQSLSYDAGILIGFGEILLPSEKGVSCTASKEEAIQMGKGKVYHIDAGRYRSPVALTWAPDRQLRTHILLSLTRPVRTIEALRMYQDLPWNGPETIAKLEKTWPTQASLWQRHHCRT